MHFELIAMFGDRNGSGEPQSVEVIRISAGDTRIVSVSPRQIEYIALTGERCTIDLEESARNWENRYRNDSDEFVPITDSQAEVDDWNARCVGTRGALDDPPWVEFMNARRTRFEFDSYEAIYRELLGPISRYGWHTFDTD